MIDVVMPQMGESIVEGTLTKWLKKPGDKVERDEPLFEISTDKVDTEIPAPVAGTMGEQLVPEGTTVQVNTIVGRIDETGGTVATPAAPAAPVAVAPPPLPPLPPPPPPPAPVAVVAPPPPPPPPPPAPVPVAAAPAPVGEDNDPEGPLSPLVRRMAREFSIDLRQVRGTGPGGRITKLDVDNYMAAQGTRTLEAPVVAAAPLPPAAPAPAPPPLPRVDGPKTRVEPMSTMRQKIAEHMVFSNQTSVHVTTVHKVDMTKVAKLRDKVKNGFKDRYGYSLTFLSFVARATTVALRQFPILNASIQDKSIIYHNDVNIGVAVALEGGNGLIVPVIRNADEKNVAGLQRAIVDLSTRARAKQLKPDEVAGGTFSITNFGSFGSVFATPIINQPQVAILGVGSVEKQVAVIEGDAIAIRSICYLALTFDHRLIDGAMADQFTGRVKQILENWSEEVV